MRRLFALTFKKLSVLFNGMPLLIPAAFIVYALCLSVIASVCTAHHSDSVRMAVVNNGKGELSCALVESLKATPGFEITEAESFEEASDLAAGGSSEAILLIEAGYDEHISDESISSLIKLTTAPGSVSAELIRETVAGKLLSQRAEATVISALESEGYDTSRFAEYKSEMQLNSIYKISSIGGGSEPDRAVFGQTFPGYEGFAALGIMLIMLTVSRQFASVSSKLVSKRLLSVSGSGSLGFFSDLAALLLVSLALALTAFAIAPDKSPRLLFGLGAYSLLITGLCLLLACAFCSGRIDLASPFIALVTSILGGCFAETGSLSPVLSLISKFTPQGQLIAYTHGNAVFLAILVTEGVVLCLIARILQKRTTLP